MDDATSAQILEEELLALTSIYDDCVNYLDESGKNLSVKLRPNGDECLIIHIPDGYPGKSVPKFELAAPLLRGDFKFDLLEQFRLIAQENIGQCILFNIIESARQFLEDNCPEQISLQPRSDCNEDVVQESADNRNELPQSNITIIHGEAFTERRSTFQAHLAFVSSLQEVKEVVDQLKKNRKIAEATHNIMAYRIVSNGDNVIADCDDDGETQAGSRLLHLLEILEVKNVVVVVSRWFGGVLLGPERFKHISNAARDILEKNGCLS